MNDLQLDALALRWRAALDTAADSLAQVGRNRRVLHFPAAELRAWCSELERERSVTDVDLVRLARATHTHLHRHMYGPRATGTLLGLGSSVEACVFDLDGVLTASTALNAAARRRELRQHGVRAYESSILFLGLAREAQLGLAIVSASANTLEILEHAGLLPLVDEVVDGNVMGEERLRAKPAPDLVLAACRRLGLQPASVATFETTAAGIAAGRSAGVGRVIAVNRGGTALSSASTADVAVAELADLIAPELR